VLQVGLALVHANLFAKDIFGQGNAGASVVRLNIRRGDLAVLNDKGVPFRPVASKDGRAIKVEVEGLGEGGRRVCEEADLE